MKDVSLNLAVSALIFIGLIMIVAGFVLNLKGLSLLPQLINEADGYFTLANTCFIFAFIVYIFDKKQ